MIGYLSGLVKAYRGGIAIIDVHGVGYQVYVSTNNHLALNQPVELYIHTHVREDAITLFGFATASSYDLFLLLTSVSGVGPKSALNILSSAPEKNITEAIVSSNLGFFTSIKGLGKKTAQKIILDLKSKLGEADAQIAELDLNQDLIDALINLGFTKVDIHKIISKLNPQDSLQTQIKSALKLLQHG